MYSQYMDLTAFLGTLVPFAQIDIGNEPKRLPAVLVIPTGGGEMADFDELRTTMFDECTIGIFVEPSQEGVAMEIFDKIMTGLPAFRVSIGNRLSGTVTKEYLDKDVYKISVGYKQAFNYGP
jgi:hypothetical protein